VPSVLIAAGKKKIVFVLKFFFFTAAIAGQTPKFSQKSPHLVHIA
jgi:hypothetical protein